MNFLYISFWLNLIFVTIIDGNFTKVVRTNRLLSRRKRYLTFPMGSNLVITMSYVKGVMQVQPSGWNVLGECDVPFALPSDTRLFTKTHRRHYMERREVYSQFAAALSQNGLNGKACVKRMICEVKRYAPSKGKSLVKDILYTIFTSPEAGLDISDYDSDCDDDNFLECSISLLDYFIRTLTHHDQ